MHRFLILVFLFGLISCKSSLSLKKKKEITDSVRATLRNYYADVERYGLNAEFKYLDSSNDFYWVPPGYDNPVRFDSIAKLIRNNAGKLIKVKNVIDSILFIIHHQDTVYYNALIHSIVLDSAGISTTTNLQEKGVMIKRNDGWKLLNGITKAGLSMKSNLPGKLGPNQW